MRTLAYATRVDEHHYSELATGLIAASALTLTILSVLLVFKGADDEPFMQYRSAQAALHVGGSAALIVLWGVFVGVVALLVRRRRIHALWMSMLVWAVICAFYLYHNLTGYLWDIENLVLQPPPYLRRF